MAAGSGLKGWTLITGASEGLGREFAIIAAAEGRDLILAARQEAKMEALAEELRAKHKIAIEVIPTDLADPDAVELLWRKASSRRRIDVLVNNAGLGYNGPFGGEDFIREEISILVNALAPTILMKYAIPHMQAAGGGRILNVASTAAFMPGPNMAVYHATKAYLLSLSEAVAEELRGGTVKISVLCPGPTATNFQKDAKMEEVTLFKRAPVQSARAVAKAGWRAMKRGKRVKVTGLSNKFFAFAPRFAPRWLTTRIAAKFLK
ncbi:SDR family oxidoreductase [Frigidibacter sp. RF13]|uniref:SDR family NAD(P)-dependent oxidoreductase n=1 Tax=Frigidibacter sp. RF13 TaxID=2997340 RepID=UPI00226EB0D8|nr:SDR family oxidoreductase [Frigidibacter sp. RF13]MCY1127221.1 SDR family oxidoreductase [Frigidibacter sp. RF13]